MDATTAGPAGHGQRIARPLLLAGWIALLAAVIVAFTALGAGPLAAPALGDWAGWAAWLEVAGPLEVVFAVGRLLVIGLAWYLAGVTVIGILARLMRWGRVASIADVLTLPWARRLLQTCLGVGLATAALTTVHTGQQAPGVPHAAASVAVAEVASLQGLAHGSGEHTAMRFVGEAVSDRVEMRVAAGEPEARAWTAAPGDHLWGIAEAVLAEAWGRAPSDPELVPYWQALVERNRHDLADPANPDLIYPGQVFTLPDPPPAPGGASA